ncbi:MAG TPA: hypothetical protein VIH56_03180 [Candidatus Acidoferrales bacterium]
MSEKTKKTANSEGKIASTRAVLREEKVRGGQSKTWGWTTDPMYLIGDGGAQIYKLDTLRFTILDDGSTQYTLSWNATSLGWQSMAAQGSVTPHVVIELQNAAGGVLDTWDCGSQDWPCGARPIVYTKANGLAGMINLAVIIDLNIGGAGWVGC